MQAPLDADARPRLARQVRLRFDDKSGQYLLLCPERGLILNGSAASILLACRGLCTIRQIAKQLASSDDFARVLADTLEFLATLRRRRLIVLVGESP